MRYVTQTTVMSLYLLYFLSVIQVKNAVNVIMIYLITDIATETSSFVF